MAHGLNPMIKREFDSSNTSVNTLPTTTTSHIQSTVANSVVSVNNSNNNSSSSANTTSNPSNSNTGNSNTTKMGSRRIFTPQFKLQVLESYRNDSDCKGNQRATARKYGIHRRQIQKWLQCETNLRSSVANSNQNTVKHQFHNINHQMPVVAGTHTTTTTGPSTISSSSNNSHHHHQQQHQQQQQQQQHHLHHHHHQPQFKTASILSLDTARHSVALTSIQARATTKCVNGANIAGAAAVVAVAAAAGSSPTLIKNTLPIKHQPYKTGLSGTILATHTPALQSSPLMQHLQSQQQQQQQHYHQHHHQQQQEQHHHHQHYQQIQIHQQQNHQHENLLMPSACLPGSPALVAANQTHELRDYQPIATTENCYFNESYKNQHIYENLQYYNRPPSVPIDLSLGHRRRDDDFINDDDANDNLVVRGGVGINEDLKMTMSLKCNSKESLWKNIETNNNNIIVIKENPNELVKSSPLTSTTCSSAVDLTCQKRKYEINVVDDCDDDIGHPTQEKLQKMSYAADNNEDDHDNDDDEDGNMKHSRHVKSAGRCGGAPVADEQQPAKPVKLFKPYLLDDNDIVDGNDTQEKKSTCEHDPIIWSHHPAAAACSIGSPEIPLATSSILYDSQCNSQCSTSPSTSRNINFLSNNNDGYPFPAGSPTFHSSSASSISSISNDRGISSSTPSIGPVSPGTTAAATTTTRTTTLWCPKGSPVSGYDTASTYSDSSDYYKSSTHHTSQSHYNGGPHQRPQYYEQHQTRLQEQIYSVDFKMQSIDSSYYHDMTTCRTGQITVTDKFNAHRNEVQRWLERDSNLRQGIALYV